MTTAPPQFLNLVGGAWSESSTGDWLEVRNPADDREIVAAVPAMSAQDVDTVYARAAEGAAVWRTTSVVGRGRVLLRAAQLLRERQEEIARDLTREMGKTLAEARGEVGKSADFFEYCGGLGRAGQGELLSDERPGARVWTVREPLGIVLALCPWNDPLLTPARKLAPALITGNAVILKPASYTPLVSIHLARALSDAGLPAGVLSTVTGSARELSEPLLAHPLLKAVSFTGSNAVGEQIANALAGKSVKLLAELGGKNASVVLDDADLELAVSTITAAGFAQAGQRCTATSRVIATEAIADQLVERLKVAAEGLRMGNGLDADTTLGPVVAAGPLEDIAGFVDRAIEDGATVVTGGTRGDHHDLAHGHFFRPTLLRCPDVDREIWSEEVFGPVISLLTVADVDTAIDAVNDSRYGLASAVFTRDLRQAMTFVDRAETGQVSINLPTSGWDVHMPFGGFGDSGSGSKEQGTEGVAWYTRTKTVALAT